MNKSNKKKDYKKSYDNPDVKLSKLLSFILRHGA